jgi:predicted acetyltransferase
MPRFARPALALMDSFVEALREGYSRDSLRPESPETIASIAADPAGFVATVANPPTTVVLPDGSLGARVPETMLWWVEGDRFIGSASIRHALNDLLAQWGGHVGYAVRPSERGKGHATAILAGALDHCRAELAFDRVLLTVNAANAASIRVIEKNGGVRTKTIAHPWIEGDTGHHYWIAL